MPAIGMVLAWLGYGLGSWGYFLVRGYDVKLGDWLNPVHVYTANPLKAGPVPASQVFPGDTAAAAQTAGKSKGKGSGKGPPVTAV
jgi:hypothetical protein